MKCMIDSIQEAVEVKGIYNVDPDKRRTMIKFQDNSRMRVEVEIPQGATRENLLDAENELKDFVENTIGIKPRK